jgi:hypothetical protein
MQTVRVEVRSDHLETLSRVKKPIFAVAEVINHAQRAWL